MTEEVLVVSADSRWTPETFESLRFAVARAQMDRWNYTDTLDDADAWVRRTAASENLVCDVHAVLEELDKLGLLLPPGGKTRVEFGVDAWMFGTLAELEEFQARVRAVTAQGMMQTAQRYFDPSRRVEGIVRGVGKTV